MPTKRLLTRAALALSAALLLGGTERLEAQAAATSSVSSSVLRVISGASSMSETLASDGGAEANIVTSLAEGSALLSALSNLFEVPVNLSRFTVQVDNALHGMDDYKAFEFLAPNLYNASRMYRVNFRLVEF